MADATPTGPLSVAVDGLRTLISNIPWFQTWTGSADAAAAVLRVFVGEVGFPIVAAAVAGGVLTITTREPHNISIGNIVTIAGAALGEESGLSIAGPQTVVGVTATTLTIATILPDLPQVAPDQAFVIPCPRPLAVVSEVSENAVRSSSIGTAGASIYNGALEVIIEADVSTGYQNDQRNALTEARNAFGSFVQGLASTQGTADLMCLNTIEPVAGPMFISLTEQDDNTIRFERWRAMVRVTWGMEG